MHNAENTPSRAKGENYIRQKKKNNLNSETSDEAFLYLIQHKAYFLIQLNADSVYPFACRSLCLLILMLIILMLIILMLILIESRSMLIVY